MHTLRVVPPYTVLFLSIAAPLHADGYFSFADVPLQGDRVVIGTTYDTQAGAVLTVLPYGNGTPGELGLVRSNATGYCIDLADDQAMLGTSPQGTGEIGNGAFEIRIDFAVPIVAPAVVQVQVQTTYDFPVYLTLYDAGGNVVGSTWIGASNLQTGHCGPGDPIFPKYMNGIFGASASSPVVSAMVAVPAPFTIESIGWMDHQVAVEPVTWGRVKALYRPDGRR
jgi:hypothetical protein